VRVTDARCPQCSAVVRAGSSWCTLCHADLRSAEQRAAPVIVPEPVETAPARGKHARHARLAADVPVETTMVATEPELVDAAEPVDPATPARSIADVDLDAMFAQLAAEHADPLLSDLPGRLSTKSTKTLVIVGGATAVTLGALVFMVILGSIFS